MLSEDVTLSSLFHIAQGFSVREVKLEMTGKLLVYELQHQL